MNQLKNQLRISKEGNKQLNSLVQSVELKNKNKYAGSSASMTPKSRDSLMQQQNIVSQIYKISKKEIC